VDRAHDLGPHERAARDDALEHDEVAEVVRRQRARRDERVAKVAVKADEDAVGAGCARQPDHAALLVHLFKVRRVQLQHGVLDRRLEDGHLRAGGGHVCARARRKWQGACSKGGGGGGARTCSSGRASSSAAAGRSAARSSDSDSTSRVDSDSIIALILIT
jgi:hypothetical protein